MMVSSREIGGPAFWKNIAIPPGKHSSVWKVGLSGLCIAFIEHAVKIGNHLSSGSESFPPQRHKTLYLLPIPGCYRFPSNRLVVD